MTWYFIYDNQLAGTTEDPEGGLPVGYRVLEGPNAGYDQLYYDPDTDTIKFKPPSPGPMYYWDEYARQWISFAPPPPPPVPTLYGTPLGNEVEPTITDRQLLYLLGLIKEQRADYLGLEDIISRLQDNGSNG